MVKTKIVETTEKYDENGNLVEKITREETTEDDTLHLSNSPSITPLPYVRPYNPNEKWEPYCTSDTSKIVSVTTNATIE